MEFSKRAEQIRRELGELEATAKQKEAAALESREPKRNVDRDQLLSEWREVAERHGLTTDRVSELRAPIQVKERDERAELQAAVREALNQITSSASSFTELKLLEQTAVEGQTRGLFAKEIRLGSLRSLSWPGSGSPGRWFTWAATRTAPSGLRRERCSSLSGRSSRRAERGRESREHRVSDRALAAALAAKPTLRAEQVEAVRHVTQHAGRVQCVSGWAGTGKTFMLDAARLAWEADGYTVHGSALSGKAAAELSKGAAHQEALPSPNGSMTSTTRAATTGSCSTPGAFSSSMRPAWSVPEAIHRLLTEVERAGARLVLVGDDKQLQSIDAGGGFAGLAKRFSYAELKEITRQRDAADRQAVYDLAAGHAAAALGATLRAAC